MGYMVSSNRDVVSPHVNNISVKMMSLAIEAPTLTLAKEGKTPSFLQWQIRLDGCQNCPCNLDRILLMICEDNVNFWDQHGAPTGASFRVLKRCRHLS